MAQGENPGTPSDSGQGQQFPQPHRRAWYTPLLQLFGGLTRPFNAEPDPEDMKEISNLQDWWAKKFSLASTRPERYRIFNEMDTFDLVTAVLDVYAEESTQKEYSIQKSLWIESKSSQMVKAGEECFRNIQAEDQVTAICRDMVKFGDRFQRLIYQSGVGILGWNMVAASTVERVEDKLQKLIGFKEQKQEYRNKKYPISWPWDYIHFRLMGSGDPLYGTSLCANIFRSWRQLTLAEDSILMFRLRKAGDRFIVWVDVQDMEESEAVDFVERWRKRFRKHQFIDPASAQYKQNYNPLSPTEDIFWPIRGNTNNSRIDSLSGTTTMDSLGDLDYFRNKFFGAAKIPPAYFGFSGDVSTKNLIMQQDVRAARTMKRIQKHVIYGFRQVLDINFSLINDEEKANYDIGKHPYVLHMAPISYLDEWERLELVQMRYSIIEGMAQMGNTLGADPKVWAAYIMVQYAKLPEELVVLLLQKHAATLDNEEGAPQAGIDPLAGMGTPGPAASESIRRKRTLVESAFGVKKSKGVGYTQLSDAEKRHIADLMKNSPLLVETMARLSDHILEDLQQAQIETTMCPPRFMVDGKAHLWKDSLADDKEAQVLREHLEELGARNVKVSKVNS